MTMLAVGARAQTVTADIRMTVDGFPPVFPVGVVCDAADSMFFVQPDTMGHFRLEVQRGFCMLSYMNCDDIWLDLQSDTSLDIQMIFTPWPLSRGYHSRSEKDSALLARAAALRADLDGMDTNRWPYQPNYVTLAQEMEDDMFYVLPRWRTFSSDTVLFYLKYCYLKDRKTYDYLYYPICQLEHRLGLKHDRRVRKPKGPDGRWYVPMPEVGEDWLTDTLTDYGGLFGQAKLRSDYFKMDFASQGEPSLVYPRRKKPAVRMLVSGGLSNSTALRVEDGRFYYCTSELPWKQDPDHRERWNVKLTRGELDTLMRCVDTLLMADDKKALDINYAIDAPNIEFEYSGPDGYRNYICSSPHKHPLTAPLAKYLDTLWRRNVCLVSMPIHDAANGSDISTASIAIDGRNYHHLGGSGYFRGPKFYLPKGRYTLRIECRGYETYETELDVRGDMALDTIFLQHKRITLRARLHADWGFLHDRVALYVDGVDTAMLSPIDWMDQTVEYHNVPAASHCYFVGADERVGGWYHSSPLFIGDSLLVTFDSLATGAGETPALHGGGKVPVVLMHLDHSRQPFHSKAEKDSTLKAEVQALSAHSTTTPPGRSPSPNLGEEPDSLVVPFNSSPKLGEVAAGTADGGVCEKLGTLYYQDALLHYIPTWQTFPDAERLAYDALRHAYHHDTLQYGYLYYPITHLTTMGWGLRQDTSIHKPTLDSTCYVPMPEELLEKHRYSRVDMLTPFREAKEENDRYRKILGYMQESSLLVPQRRGTVVRWHYISHHGGSLYSTRIENDTIYDKEFFNTFDLTDPFDTTIDQNPEHYPDTLVVHKWALTDADKDTLKALLQSIDKEGYEDMVGQEATASPTLQYFEYVLDGQYRHFRTLRPDSLPPVDALLEWVYGLMKNEK